MVCNDKIRIKKRAIIVDLDGTLVHNPDWDGTLDGFYQNITEGVPIYWCQDLVERYSKDTEIIFLTARSDAYRSITNCQLRTWFDIKYQLYMRDKDDLRADYEVKKDYIIELKKQYDILFCIDDNIGNCAMYRELDLVALHVQQGL